MVFVVFLILVLEMFCETQLLDLKNLFYSFNILFYII